MKVRSMVGPWASLWIVGCCLIGFSGCDLKEEPIPAYIHVQPFLMEENPLVAHGSVSSKVTAAFLSFGGEFLGVFTLPVTVPVLAAGEIDLVVDPVVQQNASSLSLDIYPFYERFTTKVNLAPGQVDTIQPQTRYSTITKFLFIEDFETGTPVFSEELDGNPETFLGLTTTEVFEGQRSGEIYLTKDHPVIEVATGASNLFNLPSSGGRYYLEVDYKTDVDIIFGLIGWDQVGPAQSIYEYGLFPSEDWNKVYFDLTQLVLSSPYLNFQIGIIAGLPLENGVVAAEEGRVFLDNIKLISF